MSIKHMKRGDPVVLMRTDKFGRLEFRRSTIVTVAGRMAKVNGVDADLNLLVFFRHDGRQSGDPTGQALTAWQACDPADSEVADLLTKFDAGEPQQVETPKMVKLLRALARIRDAKPVRVYQTELADKLIELCGEPGDFLTPEEEAAAQKDGGA